MQKERRKTRGKDKQKRKRRSDSKWSEEYYLKVYKLAKDGLKDKAIAETLGVSEMVFSSWKKEFPALKGALDEARSVKSNPLKEFIHERISPELRPLWEKLLKMDDWSNPIAKMEELLLDAGEQARKYLFLHALVHFTYNTSKAMKLVNISARTLNRWVTKDPEFAQLVEEVNSHKKDFIEEALMDCVQRGETAAIIFAAKTQLADRGYNPKTVVSHEGSITHDHKISLDDLALPVGTRKQLLKALRSKEDQLALPEGEVIEGEILENEQ